MNKMLLTGASGFLGSVIRNKAGADWQLTALCHRSPGPDMASLDLTDHDQVMRIVCDFQPQVIIHAAANANLDDCEKNPVKAHAINVEATATLVEAAGEVGARLIFISSDMVYNGKTGMYPESAPASPLSVYGHTKAAAEHIVLQADGPHVVARAALIYGRPCGGGSSFSEWIEKRLRDQFPVPLYTDQYRTPVLVDNLADQLLDLAANDFKGTIHCAGLERLDRYEFGKILCRVAGYPEHLLTAISMHDHPATAPRPVDVSLNTHLASQVLKTPLLTVEQGLQMMLAREAV